MTNVTLSANDSAVQGGGLFNDGNAVLINVTVANNLASQGGGIYGNLHPSITLALNNTTVSGNTAAKNGGGIENAGVAAQFTLANSIIAGNKVTAAGSKGPDAFGPYQSRGFNLIGKKDSSTGWVSSDHTGTITAPVDAKLGALANNGGLTQTLLPATGSPAINKGSNSLVPKGITTDQRGLARISNTTVDIGAVEVQVVATALAAGRVFNDANVNGKRDTSEMGLGLWTVYIDANNSGVLDSSEKKVTTDINGNWSFTGLIAGTYVIRTVPVTGTAATSPGVLTVKLAVAKKTTGLLFGEKSIA